MCVGSVDEDLRRRLGSRKFLKCSLKSFLKIFINHIQKFRIGFKGSEHTQHGSCTLPFLTVPVV